MHRLRADAKLAAHPPNLVGERDLYRVECVVDELGHLCFAIMRMEARRFNFCVQCIEPRTGLASLVPITILGGWKKSWMATDSRINSGQ